MDITSLRVRLLAAVADQTALDFTASFREVSNDDDHSDGVSLPTKLMSEFWHRSFNPRTLASHSFSVYHAAPTTRLLDH